MTEITLAPSRLLRLLEEIGRTRALTEEETDLIEEIVTQEIEPFRWNPRLDQALARAASCPGGIARFARRHDITPMAAYCRLHRLRKGCKVVRASKAR